MWINKNLEHQVGDQTKARLQVFVTYLTDALYVHPLWFYKHQHDNRVRFKLFVACQRWWFQWRFAAILVNCAPCGERHNYCTPHIIKRNFENFLIHRCNYILLSQVYCVWQVVRTLTIILITLYINININAKIFERCFWMRNVFFWFSFQLLTETFLILRTEGDTIKSAYWSYVKYPLFLSDFNEIWIFDKDFRKKKY